jgi:hypothetical protein
MSTIHLHMKKIYKVTWQASDRIGELDVAVDNFGELGQVVLDALWPPPACPLIVTKIELYDPEAYLK